ncbi:hypothetical protein [Streptomyces sp. NPDC012825]|uniref:hypothetical protein n=1 Tax=Streptomyces sp. NPDC012825 TaxID=3364851 RepID=UPI0036767708
MTEDFVAAERTALRGLLDTLRREGLVPPEWERAARAVPRSAYVPERIYLGDDLEPCDRADAPETWLRAVYADDSVVTQINDGGDPGEDGERWASSSASAPGIVFRMLRMADVDSGHRVLEIGTGTGWNAGLLSHVVGPENVTTVEVDPVPAATAKDRLWREGLRAEVVTEDGALGHAGSAPYDRLVATCSVRSVPPRGSNRSSPGASS